MKKFFLIILALAAATPLKAQTAGTVPAGFGDRLKALSGKIESIESDFTLTRTASFLAEPTVSAGRFYYLRGSGISLEFSEPEGDVITLGEQKFRIVSGGKENVTPVGSNPMLRQLQRMLTACMTGDIAMLEAGSKVTWSEQGESYTVIMEPVDKRAKKYVSRITLVFDRADMSLINLGMTESSGDSSEYRFFNKKFNTEVEASHFDIR